MLGNHKLSGLEEDLNQERDCLTRAKKDRDNLRTEVASLRQIQGFANRYGKRAGTKWGKGDGETRGGGGGTNSHVATATDPRPRGPTMPERSDVPGFRRTRLRFTSILLSVSCDACAATPNITATDTWTSRRTKLCTSARLGYTKSTAIYFARSLRAR